MDIKQLFNFGFILVFSLLFRSALSIRNMASAALSKVPSVDVDATGVFKYILVRLSIPNEPDSKLLVRGYAECNYHADVDDKLTDELQKLKDNGEISGWNTKVLGGGRIILDSPNKTIKVYGYSQGYGKADHEETVALLKQVYSDHNITWSDEGY